MQVGPENMQLRNVPACGIINAMKAKAWRLYGARDARLEDIELEPAGEEGIVVELVTNTICLSDYKGATLGTGHKRVPRDIATRPTMFGHEVSGIVREVGTKWKDRMWGFSRR